MVALAAAITEVGEAIAFEIDPYLVKKGQKAIDRLHDLGVMDKKKIRWILVDWKDATEEVSELDAAYIQPPMHQYDFEPWADFLLLLMRQDAYLYDSITRSKSGWGQSARRKGGKTNGRQIETAL